MSFRNYNWSSLFARWCPINDVYSFQVLEFLCCPDDDSRHTERQQVRSSTGLNGSWSRTGADCHIITVVVKREQLVLFQQVLLELLQVGSVVQFNEERLLMLAEKAKLCVAGSRSVPHFTVNSIFSLKCFLSHCLVFQLPDMWISLWEATSLRQDHWLLPERPPQKGHTLPTFTWAEWHLLRCDCWSVVPNFGDTSCAQKNP